MFLALRSSDRRLVVDALAVLFGIGAWLGVNGTFVQLPLLVPNAPEGWNLPSFMSICAAAGNIGAILFGIYSKFVSRAYDHFLIYILLAGGTTAMICLSIFHGETAYFFGAERSVAVLSVMLTVAIIGCTSSVLFMPYMRNYKEIYLVSYLVGEGLSGFIPSVLALIQGVGGNPGCVPAEDPGPDDPQWVAASANPLFSSTVFFAVLSSLFTLSFLGFLGLNVLPVSRRERVTLPGAVGTVACEGNVPAERVEKTKDKAEVKKEQEDGTQGEEKKETKNSQYEKSEEAISEWNMSRRTYIYLLVIMGIVCSLGNTGLSSIQSYSCLPYGNVAFHLSVTLGNIALPLAMCLGFVIKKHRVDILSSLTLGVIAIAAYLYYLALASPSPPMQHTTIGEFLVVLAWIAVNGLVGFVKLGVTSIFRADPGRGLFFTGVATQIGSLTGAVVSFCLVNYTDLFVAYQHCANYSPST